MHAQTRVSIHTCIHIYRLPPVSHRGGEKNVSQKSRKDTSCPKMPQALYQEVSISRPLAGSCCASGHSVPKTRLLQTQTNELWQLNYTQVTNFVPFAQFIWNKINWNQRASFSVKICLSCQCMPLKPMGHFKSRY